MKSIAWTVATALLVLIVASLVGVVGFHYPNVIENEPLNDPIKVLRVEGNHLHLADSRIIEIQNASDEALTKAIAESDFLVDVEGSGSLVTVHARQDGWVCGTPWAQPIRIPLFADTVYRNRRDLIAIGEFVGSN
ncbi:hypothetical protein [Rubripirellula reticaptiva]|nr:hypothetical protein [Rubripirellula reticaptiva]